MSTNSTISLFNPDTKTYLSIYCHQDGYIDGVGMTLKNHYDTFDKAMALIELGNVSALHESIECPEGRTFENPASGCTVFYGRDRSEEGQGFMEYLSARECFSEEYNYLFKGNEWFLLDRHGEIHRYDENGIVEND